MFLRVIIENWHSSFNRDHVLKRAVEEGLSSHAAENLHSRPIVYGDWVSVEDVTKFMRQAAQFQLEFDCWVLVQPGRS